MSEQIPIRAMLRGRLIDADMCEPSTIVRLEGHCYRLIAGHEPWREPEGDRKP